MKTRKECSCSRRSFLSGCGLTLTGFGVSSLFPGAVMRQAMAMGPASDNKFLFIFMRGGNDGLNSVIPHGDPDYGPVNRSIYIPPANAIDLNGFASLHPALGDMMNVYNAGELAVLHRIGLPGHSRSHFDDQRRWENGNPAQPGLFEGWLARYIDESAVGFDGDIPVLTSQATPPVLVRGRDTFFNVSNAEGFYFLPSGAKQTKFINTWRDQFNELDGLEAYRPLLSQTGVRMFDTLGSYDSWDQANWDPKDPVTGYSLFPVDAASNQPNPSGPGLRFSPSSYSFFTDLKISALALLEGHGTANGTRVAGTQMTGFDTHVGQGAETGNHAQLLSWLGYGFHALHMVFSGAANDTRTYPNIWDKTVVATMSEFGRTSKTNGSGGTDHAAASAVWIQGGPVNGGVYNCDASKWPAGTMFGDSGRYLPVETDYRAVFWEIMRDHMGIGGSTVDGVFPGYTSAGIAAQELGLIAP